VAIKPLKEKINMCADVDGPEEVPNSTPSLDYLRGFEEQDTARARDAVFRLFSYYGTHPKEAMAILAEYLFVYDLGHAAVPPKDDRSGCPGCPAAGGSLTEMLDEQGVP
jgi:hypothetical protein